MEAEWLVMKGETCELGEFIARSRGWPGPAGMTPPPGQCQVWSLTKFYSPVDFSQSRIGVEKVPFQQTNNQGLRQMFLNSCVLGPPSLLTCHT